MIQLILHILGDYLFQNDCIAKHKSQLTRTGFLACFIHVSIYSAPFYFLVNSWIGIAVIFTTHFIIDKFRLANYWYKLLNWNWNTAYGFKDEKPFAISIWLLFIVDNWFHIVINYLSIKYL